MPKPPPLELDPVHIREFGPDGFEPFKERDMNYSYSGMFGPAGASPQTRELMHETQVAVEQEFNARTASIPQTIEVELAATRLEGPTNPLPPAAALAREVGVRNTLIKRKSAEFQRQTAIAKRFYGSDPLGKTFKDYLNQASANRRAQGAAVRSRALWSESFRAAHEARLLGQTLALLNQREFPASGAQATTGPAFSFASVAAALSPEKSSSILAALRTALHTLEAGGPALLSSPALVGFAALLMPSRLGNGERFVVSVPLAELSSEPAGALREIADQRGIFEMHIGLGARQIDAGVQIFAATNDDFHIRSSIPVLNAAYFEQWDLAMTSSPKTDLPPGIMPIPPRWRTSSSEARIVSFIHLTRCGRETSKCNAYMNNCLKEQANDSYRRNSQARTNC